ncbi:hypothetical protein ACFBZI_11080 [Moraxella sp. ZJ142]|uniref:hypothetical protein n=1 Tax=Moraxella marmotae TaxID=3344520 RepID=UPI0035D44902
METKTLTLEQFIKQIERKIISTAHKKAISRSYGVEFVDILNISHCEGMVNTLCLHLDEISKIILVCAVHTNGWPFDDPLFDNLAKHQQSIAEHITKAEIAIGEEVIPENRLVIEELQGHKQALLFLQDGLQQVLDGFDEEIPA